MYTVASVWRYPVKSMLGEELTLSAVDQRGVLGDRAYALVDRETSKIASAKNPRKWSKLFECRAIYAPSPKDADASLSARVRLPNGKVVGTDEAGIDEMFSKLLGRDVSLQSTAPSGPSLEEYWPDIDGLAHREVVTNESIGMAAPAGSFFDYAPILVLTTATLSQLQIFYPEGRFRVERFRPNLVVSAQSGETGFVENAWVGRTVSIGDEVQLRVTDPCPRCVMTTLVQQELPNDPGILRTAARHNRRCSDVLYRWRYRSREHRSGILHRNKAQERSGRRARPVSAFGCGSVVECPHFH
jgi:uncharacterized protein YcbX